MLVYWSLFLIITAGALLNQSERVRRYRLPFILTAAIPTILMIGLRWKIGPDWIAYVEIFHYSQLFTLKQALLHVDPAFFLLCRELGRNGAPFWVLNLICGIVFITGLSAFCFRQPNPWLAYLLALPYLIIVIGMSGARQSVALGFLCLALNAFSDGKMFRLCILTVAGALFHGSVLLMLPLMLYSYGEKSIQRAILLVVLAVLFYMQFAHVFSVYAVRYSSANIQSGGIFYRLSMNIAAALAFIIFRKRLGFSDHESRLWWNVSLCTLGLIPLAFLLPSSTAVDRILLYLFPLQFAVLNRIPAIVASRRGPSVVTAGVIGYAALIQVIFLNFGTFSNYYVPYRTIFEVR